ncbi:MAG: hypothetical protein ACRC28_03780 [Clostridium sp.]|uniref:hypothetical protein n=1 Tax=Clostridium sp. TaxID=1506 RepID=UPI003F3A65FA
MKRIFTILILICSLIGITSQIAYGNSMPNQTTEKNKKETKDIANEYWTAWVIKSKTSGGNAYGSWERVGEARGAGAGGSLTIKSEKTVSNTYSGTLKVGKGTLESSVGYTFNSGFSRTASYTIPTTNSSKTYWVDARNIYKQTNVTQTSNYMINGIIAGTDTKTVFAKQWSGFGYDWGYK